MTRFLLTLFLFAGISLYPNEFDWGSKYKVQIKPVSNFVSELKILEKEKNKILFESLMAINHVIKTKSKKLNSKDFFFLQSTVGGEGFISANLYYFYLENDVVKQGSVEDIIDFKLINLDNDKNKELVLTDFKYYKFKVNNCFNANKPDPEYSGKLIPKILKFNGEKFILEKNNINLFKKYFSKLEKRILKKKKTKNLYWLSHYYAIATLVDKKSQALDFIKKNNSQFIYSCENTKQANPYGKSFRVQTDYFSFFQKFGNQIKD